MSGQDAPSAASPWPEGGLPHGEHPYDYGYCECYGEPEGTPLCDDCRAEERERDEERAADLFEEDVRLYGI